VLASHGRLVRNVASTAAGLVLIGLIALIPDLAADVDAGGDPIAAYRGRIESILPTSPDPAAAPGPAAKVLMLEGPQSGRTIDAYLVGPGGAQVVTGYSAGDEVVVTISQGPDPSRPFVAVSDRWRLPALQWLGLLFAAAVVLVGGWRGVRALIALGLTIAFTLKVVLPLVINGVAPLPLAVASASVITVATILLTEGWQRSSLAAIVGTTGALALTGLLGAVVTGLMGFTYTAGSDLAFATTRDGAGLDLGGLLLAAFILGAMGVLDDVTVTQAVLVDELATQGSLRGRELLASAMAVGRSHIGATINTLFLAYVGAGLPLLVLLIISRQPPALVLNAEAISTEIVRTLVGSIGIVAAVPFTTFVAVMLATGSGGSEPRRTNRRLALVALMATIAGLLLATVLLPLTPRPSKPLPPPAIGPLASFPAGSPQATAPAASEPAESGAASPSYEPVLAQRGEPLPLLEDGLYVGTVTVVDWTLAPAAPGETGEEFRAVLRFEASSELHPASGLWELLLDDGSRILLASEDSSGFDDSLAPGETREIRVVGDVQNPQAEPFLVYVDVASATILYAIPID
jgi:uncharacterized membrane protein